MKRKRSVITDFVALLGLLVVSFIFTGCFGSSSDAPEMQISGVKFAIDDTKIDDFLKAGFTIGENGKPYPDGKKIPKMTITQECELLKDDIPIANVALKNNAQSEAGIGDCTAHFIKVSPGGGEKGERALAFCEQNVMIEGMPLFTTKADDLIAKLEKKFGKDRVQVAYFKPDDMIVQHLKREKGLDIDVTKRVALILCLGDPARQENISWSVGFDLETQMGTSIEIRKSVPMAVKKK